MTDSEPVEEPRPRTIYMTDSRWRALRRAGEDDGASCSAQIDELVGFYLDEMAAKTAATIRARAKAKTKGRRGA